MNKLDTFRDFVSPSQRACLYDAMRGEEGEYFRKTIVAFWLAVIDTMPKTYEQDGMGDQAIVWLHYFKGSMDWFITERDIDPDSEGQIQAYGISDLGYGGELGYISIKELIENGVELDLHWKPRAIAQARERAAA